MRTMSAASIATEVPEFSAMPTVAATSAGESLIPSPTIATPLPSFFINSVTSEALPFGLIFAQTSSGLIPTCFATAKAVLIPSPVIMHTWIPIIRNAWIACADDGFGASERDTASIGIGMEEGDEPRAIDA